MSASDQLNIQLIAEDEIFKTVKIYNEYFPNYLISNYGRVYSYNVNRILYMKVDKAGYTRFKINKNGKTKYISGQRLVAFSFVTNPQPDKFNTVNHIDENPLNNKWINLEWCDDKYNLNWATAQKRRSAKRCKKVLQFDLENNLIAEYESLPDVKAKTGFLQPTICVHCKNGIPYKGYYWKYAS